MEKFISVDGCAFRVSDSQGKGPGSAPTDEKPILVLLHGYLESLDVWEDFSKLLTGYFRVIAPDLPGHGISQVKGDIHSMEFLADVVNGMLDQLGVEQCYMAGHSMGGYVALEFLDRYPEKLSGIILLHSTPDADTEEKKHNRQREIEIVEAGKKELLFTNAAKGFAPDNRGRFANVIEELADQISLTDDQGITALLRGMCQRRDMNETLRGSKVPQLFIFGQIDEYIPFQKAEEIAGSHPQARVLMLAGSGHMGFVEEPEATARAIIDFAGGNTEQE